MKTNKYFSQEFETESISGAGGGGCFPAGTLVRTYHGFMPIEKCDIGDMILAYDRFGVIEYGFISAKHIHTPAEYKDDLYFIFSADGSIFPNGITGNHAVYDPTIKEHKTISEFIIGDNLVDMDGNLIEIISIKIIPNIDANITVYNLTVEPQHTFLVGENPTIRVHNGGRSKRASQPRAAQEAPNTLRSSAIAKILEVVSHGEIEGVVGGRRGVFLDGTALDTAGSTPNFPNIFYELRRGLPVQDIINGFSDVERELVLTPIDITTNVVRELPGSNVAQARVTIQLPEGLWNQNRTNGDLHGYQVSYTIEVQSTAHGSTWSTAVIKTIRGKTTSAYEIDHIVTAPVGAANWRIRITRTSPADSVSQRSRIVSNRITEIVRGTHTYPKIAYVGLRIPAEVVGNAIPTRGYDVQGIKVPVPSNYNSITRTYSGDWNLSFAVPQWTDNPAWILHDLIVNKDYGMSSFLNLDIQTDRSAFYMASLYNDCVTLTRDGFGNPIYTTNLLPNGRGGTEIRYRFNGVIQTQEDAWQLIQAVASNMRAIVIMRGNRVSLLQDRPRNSIKIFNNSNVIDGTFAYSSSETTARTTVINCTFNDEHDRYLPKTISEPDNDVLNAPSERNWYNNAHLRYGYNTKDIVAYGCTSESQARRMAKWALYTELHQADVVNFSVGLNIINLFIGDVISILDNNYVSDTGEYLAGRVISVSGTSVTLDFPVTLRPNLTYTLGVMAHDYSTIVQRTVSTTAGTTNILTVSAAFPAGNYLEREFMLFATARENPRQFLIQSITESQKGVYSVTAIFYDERKFDRIEQNLVVQEPVPFRSISLEIPAVTNITFREVFMNTGIVSTSHLEVNWSWSWPTNTTFRDSVLFNIRWRRDNNPYEVVSDIPTKSFHIPNAIPGNYEVIIEVENIHGLRSLPITSTYAYRSPTIASTLHAPVNFFVQGTTGTTFTTRDLAVSWEFNLANQDITTDVLFDYVVQIWNTAGTVLLRTYIVEPLPTTRHGNFTYIFQNNLNDYGTASRNIQIRLHSRDTGGRISAPIIRTFTNALPAAPSFTIMSGINASHLRITSIPEPDVIGYIVHRSEINGFTPSDATIAYDGPDTAPVIAGTSGVNYHFRVAAYDSFGKTGLNLSSQMSSALLSMAADRFIFSGIIFTPNSPGANRVAWTTGTVSINGAAPTTILAGSTSTWTAGIFYICFDRTLNTLQVETTLAAAVARSQILATYEGGINLRGGTGDAFISGSQLLAGTVGANHLITNTAIITQTAQLASAIITNANIQHGAIANANIQHGAVHSANIANAAIANAHIQHGAIANANIQDAAIATAKIGVAQVDTLRIAGHSVTIPLTAYTENEIVHHGNIHEITFDIQQLTLPALNEATTWLLTIGCRLTSTIEVYAGAYTIELPFFGNGIAVPPLIQTRSSQITPHGISIYYSLTMAIPPHISTNLLLRARMIRLSGTIIGCRVSHRFLLALAVRR